MTEICETEEAGEEEKTGEVEEMVDTGEIAETREAGEEEEIGEAVEVLEVGEQVVVVGDEQGR